MTLDDTDKILEHLDELINYTQIDAEFESILDMFEDNFKIREKLREWYNILKSEALKFYEGKGK
jgi:2-hydroxy-3-keto-5-methylthiopentenyl-1-phosphate phosphatase